MVYGMLAVLEGKQSKLNHSQMRNCSSCQTECHTTAQKRLPWKNAWQCCGPMLAIQTCKSACSNSKLFDLNVRCTVGAIFSAKDS